MASLLTLSQLKSNSAIVSLANNTLTMEDAFHALLAFTPFKPLKALHLVISVPTMQSASEDLRLLPSLATGDRVPPVSISSTATIHKHV